MKGWLTGALKDGGAALDFACLAGVQRIAKESISSDLNNLDVDTPLDTHLAGYLTTDDVEEPGDSYIPRPLRIPNKEIARVFRSEVIKRFSEIAGVMTQSSQMDASGMVSRSAGRTLQSQWRQSPLDHETGGKVDWPRIGTTNSRRSRQSPAPPFIA